MIHGAKADAARGIQGRAKRLRGHVLREELRAAPLAERTSKRLGAPFVASSVLAPSAAFAGALDDVAGDAVPILDDAGLVDVGLLHELENQGESTSLWHARRKNGELQRFEKARDCGKGTRVIGCKSCGNERKRVPDGCEVGRVCKKCARRRRLTRQSRFGRARAAVWRVARARGWFSANRRGGRWSDKMITVTLPHVDGGEVLAEYYRLLDVTRGALSSEEYRVIAAAARREGPEALEDVKELRNTQAQAKRRLVKLRAILERGGDNIRLRVAVLFAAQPLFFRAVREVLKAAAARKEELSQHAPRWQIARMLSVLRSDAPLDAWWTAYARARRLLEELLEELAAAKLEAKRGEKEGSTLGFARLALARKAVSEQRSQLDVMRRALSATADESVLALRHSPEAHLAHLVRFFEWTPGDDQQGHPHAHMWSFCPFISKELVRQLWSECVQATGYPAPHGAHTDVREFDARDSAMVRELMKSPEGQIKLSRLSQRSSGLRAPRSKTANEYADSWSITEIMETEPVTTSASMYCALQNRRMTQGTPGFFGTEKRHVACECCKALGTLRARRENPEARLELPPLMKAIPRGPPTAVRVSDGGRVRYETHPSVFEREASPAARRGYQGYTERKGKSA